MRITRGFHVEFEDKTHENTTAEDEAARFIGLYSGCVPGSAAWKALAKTVPGFTDLDDEECMIAFDAAVAIFAKRHGLR